ncbi:MAG: serine/threonine-protein kinase [Nevskia sp.]|nr:serine/threonine-protein kinase [Nevskia sp.]
MKQGFFRSDWFAALAFALLFAIVAYGVLGNAFQGLERSTYDLGVRERSRTPSERLAVIAIDDQSIQNLGRWPWPRTLHAQLVDKLRAGGAKVIGSTVFYSESEQDAGAAVIADLAKSLKDSPLTTQIPAEIDSFNVMLQDTAQHDRAVTGIAKAYGQSSLVNEYGKSIDALNAKLAEASMRLASDNSLAQAFTSAADVLLPMSFELGRPQGRPDKPLPDYVQRFALSHIVDRVDAKAHGALPIPTLSVQVPVPELGGVAAGIGALNSTLDLDGGIRQEPLVLQYYDQFYPSLSLMLAAQALNLKPADIEVRLGEGVALGGLTIGTDAQLRMYTHFYNTHDGQPPFPVDSFYDVFAGKIPADKYKDKIVLIGATARGIGTSFPTPVSPAMAPVLTLAHTVSSLLQQDFYSRPSWAGWAELALYLLLAAYLAFAVPKLPAVSAALVTAGLVIALLLAEFVLLTGSAMWLKLTTPALLLVFGHLFMTVKKFRITEKLKKSSDAESAESNKMLGLAFQGQGQLDMAFEKFKRVDTVDDRLLDLMYNLALDFERKRQFNKSGAVYEYIAKHNPKFKDVQDKLSRAKKMESTIILGGGTRGGGSTASGTLIMGGDNTVEKPMLGRYQVERELGKGAMGVVYLGKDPKIGRMVAIKTMALSQEFEPDELKEVKERFFREAETAGRLQHPNIVSIYDAGEEHDLAYIAMEFIKGYDLVRHTKPNALLEVPEVVKIVADAADALDYAHSNGVVHRDIKPANLMLLTDTRVIKVTDFGIARITDSSKTKTGMVLGTPSYMSPEQLSGKKVDGRSDLFSLGVTLYQLLTGALPFQADSMATLMFKIANEPQAPLLTLRPDLPPELENIIAHALQKQLEARYAAGRDFARDLRGLLR